MRKVCKTDFEIIQQYKFYKKDLGHNFHLCTIYGCAGNKTAPWWKRLLSHIYVIHRFKVVEDKKCVDYLSGEKKRELIERIAKENEHDEE